MDFLIVIIGFDNVGEHHLKHAESSQMHMQLPLHHPLQASHNSALTSNTHCSPTIDQHSPSAHSKDNYSSSFHGAMPNTYLMQQSMYTYRNDTSQAQHSTSIATGISATNNQLSGSQVSMQMNNNAMDLSDSHYPGMHSGDASKSFQQPFAPYIPPAKKRRGRPPIHPSLDHGKSI